MEGGRGRSIRFRVSMSTPPGSRKSAPWRGS